MQIKTNLKTITIPKLAIKIATVLKNAGYESYLVGGAVRDYLLGLDPHDIDFATNATPDEIEQCLNKANIRFTNVGKRFGTIVGKIGDEEYEITSYRQDGASLDGRHPESITYAKTIQEDLSRRDFTMNAMALNPFTLELIDPFFGIQDMQNNVLRFVGNSNDRIKEDGLRILRAIRFAIKYELELSEEDKMALKANVTKLDNISKERKTEELFKILTNGHPISPLFLELPEILFQIIPELKETYRCEQKTKHHHHDVYEHILATTDGVKSNKFEIKLAALLHDIGKPQTKLLAKDSPDGYDHFYGHSAVSARICQNVFQNDLIVSNQSKNLILGLVEHHDKDFFHTEKQLKRGIAKFGEPFLQDMMELQEADRNDHSFYSLASQEKQKNREAVEQMFEQLHEQEICFSLKDLAVNGSDLLAFGMQGPEIGSTLNAMLQAVLNDEVPNQKEDLLTYLSNLKNQIEEDSDLESEESFLI